VKKMKNKIIVLILVLIFNLFSALAEEHKTLPNELAPIEVAPHSDIIFNFSATSYLKNDEYFNKYTVGNTALGFFMEPKISYYITPETKISGGVFLQKFFGRNNFTSVVPIFTIEHEINSNIDLILGRLYGTKEHLLEEPLFSTDRYIYNNLENGLQFKFHNLSLKSDIWVNWEKFIFKGDPFQEEFTFGTSTTLNIIRQQPIKIDLPIQTIITHKGGQIDESPLPVQSLLNASSGLRITYFDSGGHSISTEFLGFYYKGLSMPDYPQTNSQIYKEGWAIYPRIKYNYERFEFNAGYWYANKFIAPRGEHIFQCVSAIDSTYSQEIRKLITGKVIYNARLGYGVNLNFLGEYYYDLVSRKGDYSFGLYMSVYDSFLLKTFKKDLSKD
jgi:hypothetical protein